MIRHYCSIEANNTELVKLWLELDILGAVLITLHLSCAITVLLHVLTHVCAALLVLRKEHVNMHTQEAGLRVD